MSHGSFWERWGRGVRWSWINPRYSARLPTDFEQIVMALEATDRYHAKQGRSTARVVFEPIAASKEGRDREDAAGLGRDNSSHAAGPLSVYLKRHYSLPIWSRVASLCYPAGDHSPATREWTALRRVAALGIEVPEVVAVGEIIGPRGQLQSFLMLADLVGCEPLNEAIETLASSLGSDALRRASQRIIAELVRITGTLHEAGLFHKDLYLCHFFLDLSTIEDESRPVRMVLIDLHRARAHSLFADWWRSKDLAQLRFSADEVPAIREGDGRRFWYLYRMMLGLRFPAWHLALIGLRARRYRSHNRKHSLGGRARPNPKLERLPLDAMAGTAGPVRTAENGPRG